MHCSLNKMYARVPKLCLSCLLLYLASLPRKIPGTQYYFKRKRSSTEGKERVEKKQVQSYSYEPYSKSKISRGPRTDPQRHQILKDT